MRIEGSVIPLLRDQVDTDLIIRIERLATLSRGQFGRWAFESIRYAADGLSPLSDFPMNWPSSQGAVVLIAGENFGCGSSRENAVWALQEAGLELLIAPSFGEIFLANCRANRLAAATVSLGHWAQLRQWAANLEPLGPAGRITADLERESLLLPGGAELSLVVEPSMRAALLSREDDLDRALARVDAVKSFSRELAERQPWLGPPTRA
ncbi:MAG: 3-isopropylmalate dehydratase small subunit [Pseudomonadota bacterium]|jgi:3-isopropylmalate/(R)-2-methylmalate dehydratase small subunit